MSLEKTPLYNEYFNSNSHRAENKSFAQVQQELIWQDELIAQQKRDALAIHLGNMDCAINS